MLKYFVTIIMILITSNCLADEKFWCTMCEPDANALLNNVIVSYPGSDCEFKVNYHLIPCVINGTTYNHIEIVSVESINQQCVWNAATILKMSLIQIINENLIGLPMGHWRFVTQACWKTEIDPITGSKITIPCPSQFDNCCTIEFFTQLGDCGEPVISIVAEREAEGCYTQYINETLPNDGCFYACDVYVDIQKFYLDDFQILND